MVEKKSLKKIEIVKPIDKKPVVKPKEEVREIKENKNDSDEEFESIIMNPGTSSTFRYPLMRRGAPTIRIQPISAPLEIELSDLPAPRKKEEDKNDLYKAFTEKNYTSNQKYEIAGSSSTYSTMNQKQITAPVNPTLTPNFSDNMNPANSGFGSSSSTSGYPGESNQRNYSSGLEQQTKDQEKRRRNF